MKKYLASIIITLTAAACGKTETNKAVIMVQAQAAKATCVSAKLGNTEVAKCDVPGKDKVVPFVAVYDTNLTQPFQVYPLEQQKQEAPPAAPAQTAPSVTPPASPGAGSGAGAN